MIYIGDISKKDYLVLKELAEKSQNILEFGVGASTQVISNYCTGDFTSIDTSDYWIEFTKKNIAHLEIKNCANFMSYHSFKPKGEYDFIFDDGVDNLRNEFAINMWKHLKIGGYIAFHDTRRKQDISNVTNLILNYFNEIEDVNINKNGSNIIVIKKKIYEPYEEWNIAEERSDLLPKGYPKPPHFE